MGFFISHLKIDFDASLSKLSVTIGTTIVGIDNLERSLNKPFLKTPGDSSVEYDAPSGLSTRQFPFFKYFEAFS